MNTAGNTPAGGVQVSTRFTQRTGARLPVIMAPMFLVSNEAMMLAGMRSGIVPTFPTLNYRDPGTLEAAMDACNAARGDASCGTWGVNLIVQKTNPFLEKHLKVCVDKQVPLYITSLGTPAEVLQAARAYGAIVLCDVTNLEHAEKAAKLGCDGLIAVGQGAGGHAGPLSLQVLIPSLRQAFPDQMIVGAGGVATGAGLLSVLSLGADAVSVGSRFIATQEATVLPEYKQAIVDYGMEDIVMTDRISGTPCAVINTPYVQKAGTQQNWFERWLNRNKRTKKFFKGLTQYRGMQALEKAAFSATYKTMWCAGQSIELVNDILPVATIVDNFAQEYAEAYTRLPIPQTPAQS